MPTRCPYCKAEVLAGAAFCGTCGSSLPTGSGGSGGVESPSLFELPVSRRARLTRIAIVLTMDAVLAGAGIAMIGSYLGARAEAAQPLVAALAPADAGAPRHQADVKVSPPRVVRPGPDDGKPPTPPGTTKPPPATTPATPSAPPGATKPPSGTGGTKPPVTNVPSGNGPGTDDPGAVLGGISRRPDAAVPSTTPQPPPVTPPAQLPPPSPVDQPPVAPPDAAPDLPAPPVDPSDAEQTLAAGVQRTVEGHMGQVRRCWENIAKASADSNLPEGTIEIQFGVLASGSPSSVQVVQNQTGSPALGDCVVALVNSWDFPRHDGDPVVFVWPFFFQASK
jgi:hypothetical protein